MTHQGLAKGRRVTVSAGFRAGGQRGFSLLEVIIVVTIIGIIATIAIPDFSGWLNTQRVNLEAERISTMMIRARMIAIGQATVAEVQMVDDEPVVKVSLWTSATPGAARTELESVSLEEGLGLIRVDNAPATLLFQSNGTVTKTDGTLIDLPTEYQVEDTIRSGNYTTLMRVRPTGIVQFCGDASQDDPCS